MFNPNAGKYGPERTPYLDTYYAVMTLLQVINWLGYQLLLIALFSSIIEANFSDKFSEKFLINFVYPQDAVKTPHKQCYDQNGVGDEYANCGKDIRGRYIKCKPK